MELSKGKNQIVLQTIDEVLEALDEIIIQSIAEKSALGLFAYVYRRTTVEIRTAILQKKFKDNPRMERFDVRFALYYIEAYHNHKQNRPVSQSWSVAFTAARDPLILAQHIMLGMNAHINLDLGVTAAEIMEGKNIQDIQSDFILVSDILANLVSEMQSRLSRVSRFMFLLDILGERNDERFISFSISKAREQSWRLAEMVHATKGVTRKKLLEVTDWNVALIGRWIKDQRSFWIRKTLSFIRRFEDSDPAAIIKKLEE